MKKISVIMPAYNAEKYINEAIDSILAQTFTDFEFIIIDDGSTDSTCAIVESYSDSRIRFFKNEHNLGVAATLNRGLDLARGEYIARMDADDISLPTRFEKQAAYMDEHPDVVVLATNVRIIGKNIKAWPSSHTNAELKVDMLFNCCLCHPTVMMRADIIRHNQILYDDSFNKMEDYELWDRLIQKWDFACLRNIEYLYRIHGSQVSKVKNDELFNQYIELKIRMLKRLDMDTQNIGFKSFVAYCFEKNELTITEKNELRNYLLQIAHQNTILKQYDNEILLNSLRSLIIKTYDSPKYKNGFILSHLNWYKKTPSGIIQIIRDLLK